MAESQDRVQYIQTSLVSAEEKLEEARKRFSSRQKVTLSPVERKVDMGKYPALPEGAAEKELRLLFGALQRHVLDLEMKIISVEAKATDLETMLTDFMTEVMNFVDELAGKSEEELAELNRDEGLPGAYDHISQDIGRESRRYERD